MDHRIETNVEQLAADKVATCLRRRAPDLKFTISTPTGSNTVVTIHGNGAALRDAAFALDVAGYLD